MTREDDVEEDDELHDDHDEAGSGQYVQHHEVTAFLFTLFSPIFLDLGNTFLG